MGLPTAAIKPIMKDIEKLMKKHDAYISNKTKEKTNKFNKNNIYKLNKYGNKILQKTFKELKSFIL